MNKLSGIFDTHAHYDDAKFDGEREQILSSMNDAGVSNICNVGADLESSKASVKLASEYDFIYCSVGVHPTCVDDLPNDWLDQIENLAKLDKVVAIGEIGLDYHFPDFSRSGQLDAFEKQLELAQSLEVPVIIHSRDAVEDTVAVLKNFPKVSGVIHCFSGSPQVACKYVEMGWNIGFTGIVTFKNAKKAAEAAKVVPNDRIVIETDCPYMAPEPFRGSRCDSRMLVFVASKIAQIKGMLPQEFVDMTRKNAFNLYKIDL